MDKLTRLKILEAQLNSSQDLISSVCKGRFVCPKDNDFNYIYFCIHNIIEFVDGLICKYE